MSENGDIAYDDMRTVVDLVSLVKKINLQLGLEENYFLLRFFEDFYSQMNTLFNIDKTDDEQMNDLCLFLFSKIQIERTKKTLGLKNIDFLEIYKTIENCFHKSQDDFLYIFNEYLEMQFNICCDRYITSHRVNHLIKEANIKSWSNRSVYVLTNNGYGVIRTDPHDMLSIYPEFPVSLPKQ